MNRTPPKEVRQALRREVGFGCPVNGCGNPYLEWHHFDPPWHEKEHHNPEGMIALCPVHHRKADAGAYTREQLHIFKAERKQKSIEIKGQFDWLRNKLLAVVGGNFYYEIPILFQIQNSPVIWFNRDEEGYLLLNLKMLTKSGETRLCLEDNFWIARGNLSDLECPPSGKLIHAKYPNGDKLRIEYFELDSLKDIKRRYADSQPENWKIEYPITALEVHYKVGGTKLEFGPRKTTIPEIGLLRNCFFNTGAVAINLG